MYVKSQEVNEPYNHTIAVNHFPRRLTRPVKYLSLDFKASPSSNATSPGEEVPLGFRRA